MPSTSACCTLPLGPSAKSAPSRTSTFTPLGISIGFLPTRDMMFPSKTPLVELAQDFATEAALARLLVGEQALGGRDDAHAHAVQHRTDVVRAAIDPAAGTAHPLQVEDRRRAVFGIAQEDAQALHRTVAFEQAEVPGQALFLQQAADLELELRGRHVEPVVLGDVGVADTRQQVRNRIGHAHDASYQLALTTPGR